MSAAGGGVEHVLVMVAFAKTAGFAAAMATLLPMLAFDRFKLKCSCKHCLSKVIMDYKRNRQANCSTCSTAIKSSNDATNQKTNLTLAFSWIKRAEFCIE